MFHSSLFFLVTLVTISSQTLLFAQQAKPRLSAPQLFPEKTLAYLRVDDTQEFKAKLAQTSTGKLASDPQISPLLREFYGSFRDNLQAIQDTLGINLDELLSIPNGELAIAMVDAKVEPRKSKVNSGDDDEEESEERQSPRSRPIVVALIEAGDQLPAVEILLDRLEQGMKSNGSEKSTKKIGTINIVQWTSMDSDAELGYFVDSGLLVVTSVAQYIEQLAKVWTGNAPDHVPLVNNRKFTSILTRCVGSEGERPQVSFYVDPLALARNLTRDNPSAGFVMGLLPGLGVDGIQAIGGSMIMAPKDFDSIFHGHLLLANPRRGILQVLRPKRGDTEPQSWIAEDVSTYATMNWDIAATVHAIQEIYETFRGPDSFKPDFIDQASKNMGIDFQKDLLDQADNRLTIAQLIVPPARLNSASSVYALQVKNGRYMSENVLPKIFAQISSRDDKWKSIQYDSYKIYTRPEKQVVDKDQTTAIRRPEPSFTILGNEILLADSIEALKMTLDTSRSTDGLLSDSIEFKMVKDRIGKQIKSSDTSILTYQRPEESLRVLYDMATDKSNVNRLRDISANNPFFAAIVKALDSHQLPPFEQIAKYLSPVGSFVVEEENGLHYTSFGLRRGK